MATELPKDANGYPIPCVTPAATQTVTVSGISAATATALADEGVVRIVSTTDCHYKVGSSPTATTSDTFLPANVIEYIAVGVAGLNIAFIQASAGGTAYVTETQ